MLKLWTFLPFYLRQNIKFGFLLGYKLLLFRLIFFFFFLKEKGETQVFDTLYSWYLGFKFDLRFLFILLAPVLLLSALPPLRYHSKSNGIRILWSGLFLSLSLFIWGIYLSDFGTYSYIHTRLGADILEFLNNPAISAGMVWQTYPVIPFLLLIVVVSFFELKVFWHLVLDDRSKDLTKTNTKGKILIGISAFLLYAGGIYGKFAWYPLRWSEAFFSPNNFLSHFALNPGLYLVDTYKFRKVPAENAEEAKKYYPLVADYLGVPKNERSPLNFKRVAPGKNKFEQKPNIVIIVLESLAAFKSGLFGNPLPGTPHMDQLGKEGWLFDRFYVPSQATARSMFTLATGLADTSTVKTGSRNPYIVNQHSILNSFKGWEKYFFIGGSANWGNIRGIYTHNIDGLKMFEEGSYPYPRVDVWGISDYHLFQFAHKTFQERESSEPFLAIIQTAGFHRPYTIPEDRGDFKLATHPWDPGTWQKKGFINQKEYNSARFQDYALGNFIRKAKKAKYFENTIFVIYGDHGLPVLGAMHVPPGEKSHQFENFHVPLIFYGPKFFQPKRIKTFASQLDLLPTLGSFVGIPYTNYSLGRDLFNLPEEQFHGSFIYFWYDKPPHFGFIGEDYYYHERRGQYDRFFHYSDNENHDEPQHENLPELYKKYQDLARGLYFTNQYLLFKGKR